MLDICLNGSTEVNVARAEQSGSVATPARGRARAAAPAPAREEELLDAAEVRALKRNAPKQSKPPDVDFSLFVQLSQDLDPETRQAAIDAVEKLTTRARWKQDTAAVEVAGSKAEALNELASVSYTEWAQSLTSPEPAVGAAGDTGPAKELRRVTEQTNRHRYGRDVLVGVIDVGGFDFAHRDFQDADGTRWVAIWDQGGTVRPSPWHGRETARFTSLDYGSELLKEHMDAAIAAAGGRGMDATGLEPQSVRVAASHGTHVASIAAGNSGVARKARLAGVLIALRPEDTQIGSSFYDTTRIADAVDYLLALAAEQGGADGPLPVSINISLGTNGHAHDTSSTMARWIDNALTTPGRCVTVAAGNAGQVEPSSPGSAELIRGRVHAAGEFAATGLRHELGWVVGAPGIADVSDNKLELWYWPQDRIDVEVRPPGGSFIGPFKPGTRIVNQLLDNGTMLSVHSETYYAANGANRISIVLSPYFGEMADGTPAKGPVASGEWQVRLTGEVVRDGRYDAWIERDEPRRDAAKGGWRYPSALAPGSYTDDRMISSLACAERILSVANVDVAGNAAHVTSSRGPTRDGRFKPDVGADGTNVLAACGFDRSREWIEMTGTSMASPYVCGVAALMLAISPRLTSAQIQGIMLTTSSPLAGHDFAWRKDTGFGMIDAAACVEEAATFGRGP